MIHSKKRPHGDQYFLVPSKNEWLVKCKKHSQVAYSYQTKHKAIETAEYLAKENHAELIIKKPNGEVEKKLSFLD